MTEKLDLDAIEARFEALSEHMGKFSWTLKGSDYGLFNVYDRARADVPALVAEVRRLRASLEAVEETISDIITECQSASAAQMPACAGRPAVSLAQQTDEPYDIRLHRALWEDYGQAFRELCKRGG